MAKEKVCSKCGFKGKPKSYTKGSIFIEIILWLCFIVPGLIYSIWRLTSRYTVCPKCEEPNMIPIDTPLGQKLLASLESAQKKPTTETDIELPPQDETGRYIIPES